MATYVLCCVPVVPPALTEITRVLRPGGQLLLEVVESHRRTAGVLEMVPALRPRPR